VKAVKTKNSWVKVNGKWENYIVVSDGVTCKLYVNGVLNDPYDELEQRLAEWILKELAKAKAEGRKVLKSEIFRIGRPDDGPIDIDSVLGRAAELRLSGKPVTFSYAVSAIRGNRAFYEWWLGDPRTIMAEGIGPDAG